MAADDWRADSAGERLKRAREGAAELRGKAREVGARGIELWRRGLAGAASNGSSARAQLDVSARKEKGMRTRSIQSSCTDNARAEGEVRRRSRRVVVAGAVPVAGMGVGARTVTPQGITVTRLTVFDSILTAQNSNFHMET